MTHTDDAIPGGEQHWTTRSKLMPAKLADMVIDTQQGHMTGQILPVRQSAQMPRLPLTLYSCTAYEASAAPLSTHSAPLAIRTR